MPTFVPTAMALHAFPWKMVAPFVVAIREPMVMVMLGQVPETAVTAPVRSGGGGGGGMTFTVSTRTAPVEVVCELTATFVPFCTAAQPTSPKRVWASAVNDLPATVN